MADGRRHALRAAAALVALALAAGAAVGQQGGDHQSKTPPKGAPWTTDFVAARAAALAADKPIFLYSTKTY